MPTNKAIIKILISRKSSIFKNIEVIKKKLSLLWKKVYYF
ncbi:hypothetical protein SAMN02787073_1228 [Chryseobacterium vrystaatense]|uniref:Uncharacterized protein n=1 Tax=Chryseobacterium vrystaatense TaxID=307480 RepID=A0A1M4WR13_9FLAO|nr:hypothetical protein SAMN02787073_1228 [Chryseobacterium vrystaatense]